MKFFLKKLVDGMVRLAIVVCHWTRIGRYISRQFVTLMMERMVKVSHQGVTLHFVVPNALCEWRALSFSEKEPETLDWIDSLPENTVFWDIGANIGLYTVYAAKKRCCRVWAFEPSIFNLELLARTIFLNGLTDQICIVPLALCTELGANQFRMTTTEWGGALSSFGQMFGWDGQKIQQVFEFRTLGLSMKDAVERLNIPQPDFIKMDVDGIEHLILKGGNEVLRRVKGILIEVNDGFYEQAEQCKLLLTAAGLVLKEKKVAGYQTHNQIWVRELSAP